MIWYLYERGDGDASYKHITTIAEPGSRARPEYSAINGKGATKNDTGLSSGCYWNTIGNVSVGPSTILDAFLAKFYQCRIRRPFSPCCRTNYYVSTLYLSHSDRLFVPTLAKGTILCYTACLVWPGCIPGCSHI